MDDETYDHKQWEEGDEGPEKQADDATDAVCRDLLGRFNSDVGQAIAHLIEHYWDWDKARDWMSDQWEQRSPLPNESRSRDNHNG